MPNEKFKDGLYLLHAFVVWAGGAYQAGYIFWHKSAEDITLFWIVCLFISELVALPRAIGSPYVVWKLCHIVASVLIAILLVGVILYG